MSSHECRELQGALPLVPERQAVFETSHVYVAELDRRSTRRNPGLQRQSGLGPFQTMRLCWHDQPSPAVPHGATQAVFAKGLEQPHYRCFCSLHEENHPKCTKFTKASKVHQYMTGKLKSKIHKRWNPVHTKLGKIAEETLGEHLRSRGYAVWFDKS